MATFAFWLSILLLLACIPCGKAVGQINSETHVTSRIQKIRKINLGRNVNSIYSELAPIISPDGRLLFFTMGVGNPHNLGDEQLQDCYVSVRMEDGSWSVPHNLGTPINSGGNDAISGVSPDGNVLFIKNFVYNHLNGLCFARRTRHAGGWEIDSIAIDDYKNSNPLSTQCISADFNYILFSAEREDGYGALDLYVSKLIDRSHYHYGKPQNLGPIVNTPTDDFAPFLAPDGQSLYFSSRGHGGFGDADVFVSKRLDDSWVNWTTPHNLGPEINTPGMDAYYSIPASGDVAYFSSSNGENHMDIYKVTLTEDIRPNPVILVTGRVVNRKGQPIDATLSYTHLLTDSVVATSSTNPSTGHFAVVLPFGQQYGIRAEAAGFLPYSDHLDLVEAKMYREITMTIVLDSIAAGGAVTLKNIFFDLDKATLRPESRFELDKLGKLLKEHSSWSAAIEGYTDSLGTESYNETLSKARAQSVVNYLIEQGIAKNRLSAAGYGAAKPVATNTTEEGRSQNRRVIFRITKTSN